MNTSLGWPASSGATAGPPGASASAMAVKHARLTAREGAPGSGDRALGGGPSEEQRRQVTGTLSRLPRAERARRAHPGAPQWAWKSAGHRHTSRSCLFGDVWGPLGRNCCLQLSLSPPCAPTQLTWPRAQAPVSACLIQPGGRRATQQAWASRPPKACPGVMWCTSRPSGPTRSQPIRRRMLRCAMPQAACTLTLCLRGACRAGWDAPRPL